MPPKCSICTHDQVEQIDTAIQRHVSFRDIAGRWPDLTKSSVARHAEGCLELDLQLMLEEKRIRRAINVYDEFDKNLELLEQLREAAISYLASSDPNDPLRLTLVPRAHELEIVYLDFNDMYAVGEEMRPKKKTARLDQLLEQLHVGGFEADEIKIKTTDIRKYALEVIDRVDMTLDKFARMGGHYQKNRQNEADVNELIEAFAQRLIVQGWERLAALNYAREKFGEPKQIPARVAA